MIYPFQLIAALYRRARMAATAVKRGGASAPPTVPARAYIEQLGRNLK